MSEDDKRTFRCSVCGLVYDNPFQIWSADEGDTCENCLEEAAAACREADGEETHHAALPIFYDGDFPNMASHCPQQECGFSIYRGVLVQWDEDHDTRVLSFIDSLSPEVLEQLQVVQEHKAVLGLVWSGPVPEGYEEGNDLTVENADVWTINSSVSLLDPERYACNKTADPPVSLDEVLARFAALRNKTDDDGTPHKQDGDAKAKD